MVTYDGDDNDGTVIVITISIVRGPLHVYELCLQDTSVAVSEKL